MIKTAEKAFMFEYNIIEAVVSDGEKRDEKKKRITKTFILHYQENCFHHQIPSTYTNSLIFVFLFSPYLIVLAFDYEKKKKKLNNNYQVDTCLVF